MITYKDLLDIWIEYLGWSPFKYELCGIQELPLGETPEALGELWRHLPAQLKGVGGLGVVMHPLMVRIQ